MKNGEIGSALKTEQYVCGMRFVGKSQGMGSAGVEGRIDLFWHDRCKGAWWGTPITDNKRPEGVIMRRYTLLIFATLFLIINLQHVLADDGIPDNCENQYADFYRPNLFPRYEPQSRRLLLVDWTTGAEVMVLAENLDDARIQGWSANCQYLAAAVGPVESMDSTVWDTVNNVRIGAVRDAHLKPHPITWGPQEYLVVETRNGAILWNVPANTQITLTDSFDPVTGRNFSRLRWSTEHNQLIANFAVGGRTVFDLTTGAEAPFALNVTDSVRDNPSQTGEIVVGGKAYPCQIGYEHGYRNWYRDSGYQIPGVYARYNLATHFIYLALDDLHVHDESLAVIEGDVNASWYQFRGWSANCRYFAASLGIPGEDASDTAIYDVIERRRVGTIEDARQIMHPVHWGPIGDVVMIETRDGAFLWHLPSNTRTLITENVETALEGRSGIRSFKDTVWDVARNQLLAIEFGSENRVKVYDAISGVNVIDYTLDEQVTDLSMELSANGDYLMVFSTNEVAVWNRNTNQRSASIHYPIDRGYGILISPDGHYLIRQARRALHVWDLTNLNADTSPTYTHEDVFFTLNGARFIEPTIVERPDYRGVSRLNILTGEITIHATTETANSPISVDGITGMSIPGSSNTLFVQYMKCDGFAAYNSATRQLQIQQPETGEIIRVIETDLNQTRVIGWSPYCRYLVGRVDVLSNNSVPYDDNPADDIYRDGYTNSIIIWDAETGGRVATFENPYHYGSSYGIAWSPGGDRATIMTSQGRFLINLHTGETVLLVFDLGFVQGLRGPTYWDYQRGQILVGGVSAVHAFDMRTGIERARFQRGSAIKVSHNNTILFTGLSIWNLDTYEDIQIDVDLPNRAFVDARVALSPDERYLVMGEGMIRVWDLQNLPEALNDRDPTARYDGPYAYIRSIRFVDNVTVETISVEGTQYWNIETGAEVSAP
jgi:WD40 repeat protein